jgi:hypothetical protein
MKSLEGTDESSLSDGSAKLFISAAIEQHHLHESIFRLFATQEILVEIFRGNICWSSIRRARRLFPHQISPLISIRRI